MKEFNEPPADGESEPKKGTKFKFGASGAARIRSISIATTKTAPFKDYFKDQTVFKDGRPETGEAEQEKAVRAMLHRAKRDLEAALKVDEAAALERIYRDACELGYIEDPESR